MNQITRSLSLIVLIVTMLTSCKGSNTQVPIPTATPEILPTYPDSPGPVDSAKLVDLEAYIVKAMNISGVPGVSVAIVQDGAVIYAKGFGVRQAGGTDMVDVDTLMMIGSTSKSMTTMMMATIVDDGLMKWDTPVTSVYPAFALSDPSVTEQTTMHDLVCACTGVPRYDLPMIFHPLDQEPEGMIASLAEIPLKPGFGITYQYNNQMVASGGYISAILAGGPSDDLESAYTVAMQARVFDPIGMSATKLSLDSVRAFGNYALPHGPDRNAVYQPYPIETEKSFLTNLNPAGGVWSSANDMARYLVTELNQGVTMEGKRVVSVDNLTFTWQPQVDMGDGGSYALGWMRYEYDGLPLVEHNGLTMGYTANLAFLPTAGLGIVILSNGGMANGLTGSIRERFFQLAFDQTLTSTQLFSDVGSLRETMKMLDADLLQPDMAKITPFLGAYHNEVWGDLRLILDEDRLLLDLGEVALEAQQVDVGDRLVIIIADPSVLNKTIALILRQEENGEPCLVVGASFGEIVFTRQD